MRTVPPTRSSRNDTRLRILQAAGSVFTEKGFDGATIKDITAAAKANVAAVNYHFGSKRKLYLEALRLALPDVRATLIEAPPGSNPKEELRLYITNFFSVVMSEDRASWYVELASREIVSPTEALPILVEENFGPRMRLLENIVRKFCAWDPDPLQLQLVTQSIFGLCGFWILYRRFLPYIWPQFSLSKSRIKVLADWVYELSLKAVATLQKPAG